MNAIIINLKKVSIAIFLSFVVIIQSCSEDPSSPKKENEDPIPQDVLTIGVEGGTVEKDDFKITIPAGAFNENHDISISEVDDDGAFGENSVSAKYKISNLPVNYNKALTISITDKNPADGIYYIAAGHIGVRDLSDNPNTIYSLHQTVTSGDTFRAEIPSISVDSLYLFKSISESTEDNIDRLFELINKMREIKSNHFEIKYPIGLTQSIQKLSETLDATYEIVTTSLMTNLKPRLYDVSVVYQNNTSSFSVDEFNISRNDVLLENFDKIKTHFGKDFINMLIKSMNKYVNHPDDWSYGIYRWLKLAILSWIEEALADSQTFKYPIDFANNTMAPFNGLQAGHNDKILLYSSHGIGMSSLIKYLVNFTPFNGNDIIGTYNLIGTGLPPAESLIANVDAELSEWWPDYFKKLVNNELFELPNDYFINNAHEEWNVNTETDTLRKFNSTIVGKYPDLSAKIFKINLNYTGFDNSQNLSFKIDRPYNNGDLCLIFFAVKDNKPEYIETIHSSEYEIEDLKTFSENQSKQILAILVNSNITSNDYLGESDIDLTVSITPKVELPACNFDPSQYDQCNISIMVSAQMKTEYTNETTNETETLIFGTGIIDGHFNGNTFTGVFENEFKKDTITVTINENLNSVESLNWSGFEENTSWNIYWVKGFTINNIPLNCQFPFKFDLLGNDVYNKIIDLNYVYSTSTYTKTITGISADETSNIIVEFSKK